MKAFIQHLEEASFFLELNSANPFRIRALKNAPESLASLTDQEFAERLENKTLTEIKGIGKGIAAMATSFAETKVSPEMEEAQGDLPRSLLEMKDLKGLGPKKIKILYEGLGTASLGELEYACNENRLVSLKGFGEKTQDKIKSEIERLKNRRGKFLLSEALSHAQKFESKFKDAQKFAAVGALGSRQEIVESIDYIVFESKEAASKEDAFIEQLRKKRRAEKSGKTFEAVELKTKDEVVLKFYWADSLSAWACGQVYLTSSEAHWNSLVKIAKKKGLELKPDRLKKEKKTIKLPSAEKLYAELGLDHYPPESREFAVNSKTKLDLVELENLQGAFHAHSTYSDGAHSLKAMVEAAQKKDWNYLGMSEHSQSSFYAQGLKPDELKKQWAEIDALNKKQSSLKVLKGIESDILKDGSLDYPKSILQKFDFVIASIHQRYGMKEMTDRTLKAIEQPFMNMLGHWSGRLLLSREAYGLDKTKIIKAAIANKVVIELNSHPQRLDMDWRDVYQACQQGLVISINPDAHSIEGFDDVQYGVWMARKALVSDKQILNTWSLKEVNEFLCHKKSA